MLSSLNPVSERSRGHRFWVTASWYLAGSTVGGALLGLPLAGAAGAYGALAVPGAVSWGVVIVTAALAVASDVRLGGRSLPVHPRQVDERWLTTYRRWIYAGGYGVQIGAGFATYIMTAAVYVLAVLAVVTGEPATAFVGALLFGAVRGCAIGVAALAREPDALRRLLARVERAEPVSALLTAAVCAAVGAVAAERLAGPVAAAAVAIALAGLLALAPQASEARAMVARARRTAIRPEVGSTSSMNA
jgi:hypothetical protein